VVFEVYHKNKIFCIQIFYHRIPFFAKHKLDKTVYSLSNEKWASHKTTISFHQEKRSNQNVIEEIEIY